MSFFYDRVAESQPEPQPVNLGELYRQHQAAKPMGASGSMIYQLPLTSEQRAQLQPRSHFVTVDTSLESYARREPVSKWAQRADEGDDAYLARTNNVVLRHLDQLAESDQELILSTRQAIAERAISPDDAWARHRQVVDNRTSGLSGQQQLGNRAPHGGVGGGEQQLAFDGHIGPEPISAARPMSSVAVHQFARQAAQRGQAPQRTAVPGRSSGDGWLGVDR